MSLQLSASLNLTGSFNLSGSMTSTQVLTLTASYSMNSVTSSYISSSNIIGNIQTSSYALSSSYAPTDTNITASWANNVISSSYSLSSSYAPTNVTTSWSNNSITASYVLNAVSSSYSPTNITSSWSNNSVSSSYSLSSSYSDTSSYVNFTGKTTNYIPKWSSNQLTGTSLIFDNGTNIGIGTTLPNSSLQVVGNISASSYTSSINNAIGFFGTSSWAQNSATASTATNTGTVATSVVRLTVGAQRSNANTFYFNAFTRTSDTSASPSSDSAFLISNSGLTAINLYLRQSGTSPSNSTAVVIYKVANGTAFASATAFTSAITQSIAVDTISTYTWTGLTINQFDSIFIQVTPAAGSNFYGIVTIT